LRGTRGIAAAGVIAAILTALLFSSPRGEENPEAFVRIAENGYCPVWTPDGSRVIFGSMGRETFNIWSVSLADGATEQLTHNGGFHPAVSPDGKFLSYDHRGAFGNVFRVRLAGGEAVRITPPSMVGNFSSWSPDGSTIVFESGGDIWSIPSGGGSATRLISDDGKQTRPAFSPDGRRIALDRSDPESGNVDIWIYDLAGATNERLTHTPGKDMQPHWSPNATAIAFMSDRGGNMDVWIKRVDGSMDARLTYSDAMDVWPRWSPDGTKIAFGSDRSGSTDIWIVDLERQLGTGTWSKLSAGR
jgi:Tol biopolymer transport system component